MAGVGMEVLRFRGIDTMRLGGVRVMGGTAVSPLHFLGEARKKPACLVLEGPKGVTQGGAVQLLLSPEIRPLIRDLFDIVLMVRDEQKTEKKGKTTIANMENDWVRAFLPTEVFPRVSTAAITLVGKVEGNLLFDVDGVSVRVTDEKGLKSDPSILARPSVLINNAAKKMEELVPFLDYVRHVLKNQVIEGKAVEYNGVTFDPKKAKVMQAGVKEDDITTADGRIITSLSCTTTYAVGVVKVAQLILEIKKIIKGTLEGDHTFTDERALPFMGRTLDAATGATKATGLALPEIEGWGNFTGKVTRVAMDEPSWARIQMEVEGNNTSLTNDQFLNAMLRVALERPDLIGIVDNRLLPPKEQGLSLAFREAPQRAVVDLDDVKYDNRINQFSIRGRYNNVAGFNFVLMRGVFAIFRQLDIPVRDIWDIAPKPHAIMGPEALEIEIASREGQKD